MKLIIHGALGRMGQTLTRLAREQDHELLALVDRSASDEDLEASDPIHRKLTDIPEPAGVVVDFSHHSAVTGLLDYCVAQQLPVVVATTGHTEEERAAIRDAAEQIPVFASANMSVGIALLRKLAQEAAAIMQGADIEIVDVHHNRKLDAPSGTALLLAEAIQEERPDSELVYGRSGMEGRQPGEITIHALRMGNVVGDHEIVFATDTETIRVKHEAHDRSLFAEGALRAARFLADCKPGLYDMDDLLAAGQTGGQAP